MRNDHGADLHRLVYASRASLPALVRFDDCVEDIVRTAAAHNTRNGVTGLLLAHDGWFLQVLEGERRVVSATYRRIVLDVRHTVPELIEFQPVPERLFGHWAMCARTLTPAASSLLDRIEADSSYDPRRLSATEALVLLSLVADVSAEVKVLDQMEP